jgi:hypothetical protein
MERIFPKKTIIITIITTITISKVIKMMIGVILTAITISKVIKMMIGVILTAITISKVIKMMVGVIKEIKMLVFLKMIKNLTCIKDLASMMGLEETLGSITNIILNFKKDLIMDLMIMMISAILEEI